MADQKTEAWVKTATPEQIDTAHRAGELEALLGRDAARQAKNPTTDADYANSLGISVEEFGHIEDAAVLEKISNHLTAKGVV
ncbi:hypothetical protein [Subtercola endophyticus]|uniref:hypothetical protein n=1 Tax=Subtercola endophyticus TaxID=2895559 RepID=UPI001E4E7A57|nr:hypothetical protein [Subtercola endophyticus]UFS58928.1 hypothetical protein LQ955_18355 [Subtercola endophyticus]